VIRKMREREREHESYYWDMVCRRALMELSLRLRVILIDVPFDSFFKFFFVNNRPRKQNLDRYSSWNVIDVGVIS